MKKNGSSAHRTVIPSRTKQGDTSGTKVFVLDTNVLVHDPMCIYHFEENDIVIPLVVLEELDNHKKGKDDLARDARQVGRTLDELIKNKTGDIKDGVSLNTPLSKQSTGKLFLHIEDVSSSIPRGLSTTKADNQIIAVVIQLKDKYRGREVILVSKDINMRIKACALNIEAQDYFNDQVLEDTDLMYSGSMILPDDFWDKNGNGVKTEKHGTRTLYHLSGPDCQKLLVNQFVYQEGVRPIYAIIRRVEGVETTLETLIDYAHEKNNVWGVTARNREQNFALNLLMDPEVDFVTLLGQAGTGKTLLTLAAALHQVLDTKTYSEIIMTRVTVPIGEDIGFLPGSEEDKMGPWMGALEDNLEVLNKCSDGEGKVDEKWGAGATNLLLRNKIKIKSLNFMRGRTFLNKFLIIDEAQNLTPKQMKALITRAGPGTKVVCLGNVTQIDTPYLTEGSSGITYVVDRFKGWSHGGHIILQRGERSRLADFASETL